MALGSAGDGLHRERPGTPSISANQLSVLFLPIMLSYGLAFVLVLFARWKSVRSLCPDRPVYFAGDPDGVSDGVPPAARQAALRTSTRLIWSRSSRCSTAGQPTRKSSPRTCPGRVVVRGPQKPLLPEKYRNMMRLSDDGKLSGPMAGLFISPISRGASYNNDIYKGSLQEYAPLILGSTNVPFFRSTR